MGDRFVVGFRETKQSEPIWLYSHWGGSERTLDIAKALEQSQPRWSDASYATRIAISQIVGSHWEDETGFGVSAGGRNFTYPDYDDVHVITWSDRTVETQTIEGQTTGRISFEGFLSMIPALDR
jgi:hypothetical protein